MTSKNGIAIRYFQVFFNEIEHSLSFKQNKNETKAKAT